MLIIPAIDLKDGQCVRLKQGVMEDSTVFSDDPVAMARRWVNAGARRLHLVDLNGAFDGVPVNDAAVKAIASAYPELPMQLGGGIRSLDTIEAYLLAGVDFLILGTQAVKRPEFVGEACKAFPGHIIVGLDAKEGLVATDGWAEVSSLRAIDLAKQFEQEGVAAIVYTDISRDGTLEGPNIEEYRQLGEALTKAHITASGGVGGYRDLLALQALEPLGVDSVIVGRALYENQFPCQQFWCWHKKGEVDLERFSTARLASREQEDEC